MKILKLLLLPVVLFTINVKAQERKLLTGVKVGASYSTFSGFRDVEYIATPAYGLFANIPVSEKLNIQAGLDASFIGWYKDLPGPNFDSNTIPVISIPLLAKYYFVKGFHLQAGGELSMLSTIETSDVEGGYHKYNSGLIGGLGYDLPKVQIYIRYNYGITNINTSRNVWTSLNGESVFLDYTEKSRLFQLGVEYRLYKKKEKNRTQRFGKYARPQ